MTRDLVKGLRLMADGYLDLLGNALKDTVIHSFPDEAALILHPGTGEGQIASTVAEGTFWIWTAADSVTGPRWVQVSTANTSGGVSVFTTEIVYAPTGATFTVPHGMVPAPEIQVVDANGKVLQMEVAHSPGSSLLTWEVALSVPVTITATGVMV